MTFSPRCEWGSQLQWAVTAPLLAAELVGVVGALEAALTLSLASIVYYAIRLTSIRAYRVQVRLGFTMLLAMALVPGLTPLLWVPLAGTSAQVLFGYCPMARLLDLAPWNRREAFTFELVRATVTRPAGDEGLLSHRLRAHGITCHPGLSERQSAGT
jgi:hypothetical protein